MSEVPPVLAEKSIPAVLRSSCVSVVEATQDRDGADIAARGALQGHGRALLGSPLPQALTGPNLVEARHVFVEDTSQLALTQDDDVVEALAPDAAEEALACRVLARCALRRPYLRDAACRDNVGEGFAKLAVVVADEDIVRLTGSGRCAGAQRRGESWEACCSGPRRGAGDRPPCGEAFGVGFAVDGRG